MSLNIRYSEVIVFVIQVDPDLPTGSEAWHYQWLACFASIQNEKKNWFHLEAWEETRQCMTRLRSMTAVS